MTVQQHAPQLEQVRPPFAVPRSLWMALVAIAVLAAVIVLAFIIGPEASPQGEPYPFVEQMQQLRELIPRGSI
jgi:predicted PurR-regulated permease PerM